MNNPQTVDKILHAIITIAVLGLAAFLFSSKAVSTNVEVFASSIVGAIIAYWFSTMSNRQNTSS